MAFDAVTPTFLFKVAYLEVNVAPLYIFFIYLSRCRLDPRSYHLQRRVVKRGNDSDRALSGGIVIALQTCLLHVSTYDACAEDRDVGMSASD